MTRSVWDRIHSSSPFYAWMPWQATESEKSWSRKVASVLSWSRIVGVASLPVSAHFLRCTSSLPSPFPDQVTGSRTPNQQMPQLLWPSWYVSSIIYHLVALSAKMSEGLVADSTLTDSDATGERATFGSRESPGLRPLLPVEYSSLLPNLRSFNCMQSSRGYSSPFSPLVSS